MLDWSCLRGASVSGICIIFFFFFCHQLLERSATSIASNECSHCTRSAQLSSISLQSAACCFTPLQRSFRFVFSFLISAAYTFPSFFHSPTNFSPDLCMFIFLFVFGPAPYFRPPKAKSQKLASFEIGRWVDTYYKR